MTRPRIYTARVGYVGLDALDISRKSSRGVGTAFAPSWDILRPALDARAAFEGARDAVAHAEKLVGEGELSPGCASVEWFALEVAEREWRDAWARYVEDFTAEMRRSYVRLRDDWNALLVCPLVTLCCYCTDPAHCHRTLLARDIFPKLGCTYGGERPSQRGLSLADKLLQSVQEELTLRGER